MESRVLCIRVYVCYKIIYNIVYYKKINFKNYVSLYLTYAGFFLCTGCEIKLHIRMSFLASRYEGEKKIFRYKKSPIYPTIFLYRQQAEQFDVFLIKLDHIRRCIIFKINSRRTVY